MESTIALPPIVVYFSTSVKAPLTRRSSIKTEITSRPTYPNPFAPSGIEFDLPEDAHITLTIFDKDSREIATLVDHQWYKMGTHVVDFEARGFAEGMYFYRLLVESSGKCFVDTKRIVVGK